MSDLFKGYEEVGRILSINQKIIDALKELEDSISGKHHLGQEKELEICARIAELSKDLAAPQKE